MNYFYEVVSSAIYRIKKVGLAIQLFLFISYEDPESLLKTTAPLSSEGILNFVSGIPLKEISTPLS